MEGLNLSLAAVWVLSSEARPGLGFWRSGPRILAALRASEIGGVDGRRRAFYGKYRVSFWDWDLSGKYGVSFAGFVRRFSPSIADSALLY